MKFTKPDLHLLVVCIASLVLFALGGARVFHASNDFVPVYTGARCNLVMLFLFLLYLAAIFSLGFSCPAAIEVSPVHEPAMPVHR
jgi:hypothetical protein